MNFDLSLNKIRDYFERKELWKIDTNLKEEYPLRYPLDFVSNHEDYWQSIPTDKNGIPIKYYKQKIVYNPTRIAGYALYLLKKYLDSCELTFYDKFIELSNWFINNIKIVDNKFGRYEYDINYKDLKKGWISGMAQGQAISVLLRVYLLTKREIYLDTATLAMNSLTQPLEEGGVLFKKKLNDRTLIFFEEVPTKNPTHILNGNIYALIGFYDYLFICDMFGIKYKKDLKVLFNLAIESLKSNLYIYDASYWSKYDIKSIASYHYHWVHIAQLEILYKFLGIPEFIYWNKKFRNYTNYRVYIMRAFLKKLVEKGFDRLRG